MKKFVTVSYEISSEKIKEPVRFCVLTDLHGLSFGEGNEGLRRAIDACSPDGILIAGDMIVRNELSTLETVEGFLKGLAERYPVYYSLGNHEYRIYAGENRQQAYLDYESRLGAAGIRFLHNERARFSLKGSAFAVTGLELPMEYYKKPKSPRLTPSALETLIGRPEPEAVNILLAHNPKYGSAYLGWGAELILSGHYHGGVVRLSRHVGLSCPQYLLFPPYCCGDFHRGKSHMIVSAGIGEHTVPIRIHNPRELLLVELKPEEG